MFLLMAPFIAATATLVERSHLGWVTPLEESRIATTLEEFLSSSDRAVEMGEHARTIVAQHYT